MCAKNNIHKYVAQTSNNSVISSGDFYCCLMPQCEALHTWRSGFSIATVALKSVKHYVCFVAQSPTFFQSYAFVSKVFIFMRIQVIHLKELVFLHAFEESVDCHLLSSFCDDSNLHISLFKYVLSTMGVSKESISKFLIGNRFQVKLRILSPIWIRTEDA